MNECKCFWCINGLPHPETHEIFFVSLVTHKRTCELCTHTPLQ